ncbi:MAG: recombinase family protein [Lachnospiraceae bacterium]|nr:recombinase family protein [Lachnospiraceae bacterium]
MKNGCLYIRVSTDDQLELSPDAQERLLLDYAHKNNILINAEHIFYENGVSGRKADKRPAFQQMIALAKSKEHPFDVILVWKFSRFARNQEESIVYKSLLKKNDVDVISISEPLPDGMIGSLVERIFEWMDEYYSINLAVEVTRGMTENAMRGNYQSITPIGYKHTGFKEVPVIDEDNKHIVEMIFRMFNEGVTFNQIARHLNECGYKTVRGSKWENRTVKYILQNPFYIGKVRWNYCDKKANRLRTNDDDNVIIADGKHEPIIDMDTWNATQDKLGKVLLKYTPRDVATCKHWLSGMLRCSVCGSSLGYNRSKSSSGFNCYKYLKGMCSPSHFISERFATNHVIQGIEDKLESLTMYDVNVIHSSKGDEELQRLNKQLAKANGKLLKIKEAYVDGIDTLDEYKENKKRITQEIDIIKNEITALSGSKANLTEEEILQRMTDNMRHALAIIKDENSDYVAKGNALRSIVEKIVYDKPNNSYTFYFQLII